MFSDNSYLFDAGWLFFAVWSIVLIALFVIAFGEDLLGDSQNGKTAGKNSHSSLASANFRGR